MEGGGGDASGPSDGGFGGDASYGGSDSFGDASGFTGSEGANLGGDFSGTTFGDMGGLGDGGLTGFGDLSSMLSDPLAMEGLLGNLGFSDMGDTLGNFGYGQNDLGSLFSDNQSNIFSELFQGKLGKGLMGILGLADKTGIVSNLGKFGSLATNPDQGKGWGSFAGGMFGGMLGGPLGAMAGSQLGGMMGQGAFSGLNNAGLGAASASAPGNGEGSSMLEGLGGMYSAYKGMSDSGKMLGGLQGLYSQNSPYAQQMRQSLQRRDAAGGRRSQYGPREVELQAKLAQMASSQIPAMNQLQQRQNMNRAIMLQQGLGAFNKMGGLQGLQGLFGMGGAGGMFDQAASGLIDNGSLGNLFSLDPFQNSLGQLPIPEYDLPDWGG